MILRENSRSWSASVIAQCGCFLVLWLMSYFGSPNPYSLGLLSGFGVCCLGLAISLFARRFGKSAFAIVLFIVCTSYLFLIISNWWYFDYFQSYYNYDSLKLGGDIFEGTRAIPAVGYRGSALTLLLVTMLFATISVFTYARPVEQHRGHTIWALPLLVALTITVFLVDPAIDRYRESNIAWMLPSHMHPVQAFFYSQKHMKTIQAQEIAVASEFRAANRELAAGELSVDEFASRFSGKQYNVIVIMLESMRADLVGHYSNDVSYTPNLDRLAKQYISARNFYANTNFTVSGELAALCGIFDHNTRPPMSKYHDQIESLDCLPQQLRDRGYETLYMHGHNSRFYDRDKFIPLLGFSEIYFHGDREWDQSKRMGWGVSDLVMTDIVMDRLEEQTERPFFAHFMTLSSHYPFNNDWGIDVPYKTSFDVNNTTALNHNYQNAAHFADYTIGKFWDRFAKSTLFDNTIVVITSDHGIWTFGAAKEQSMLMRNERFFRAPLIIYHPDVEDPFEIEQLASQIDIAPTISALMGLKDIQSQFMGKNMLLAVSHPWSISFKTSQIMVKHGNRTCFIEADICAGVHQACSSQFDTSLFWKSNKEQITCVHNEDDLLRGGTASGVASDPELIQQAQDIISFHNKSAVSY